VSYKFFSEIRVRLPETDVLGVVYHGCFFTYFDVARMDYLRNLGLLEEFRTGESLNLIVHTAADFRSPARFDDVLLVHTRILKIGDSSVTFDFRVDLKPDGASSPRATACTPSSTRRPGNRTECPSTSGRRSTLRRQLSST
jgi:acyl-CoA thioester hydrolase